ITDENGVDIDNSEYPKLKQMWIWDDNTCKEDPNNDTCKKCKKIRDPENKRQGNHHVKVLKKVIEDCPTQSMKFKSALDGEVILLENQLYKCDPNGCKACVNICPTESFFIPQTAEDIVKYGKIACNEETCMYCGACENACPEEIIIVKRGSVDIDIPEQSKNKPWMTRWENQLGRLTLSRDELTEKVNKEQEKILVSDENGEEYLEDIEISPPNTFSEEDYQKDIDKNRKKLEIMDNNFRKPSVRIMIHKKKMDKLKRIIERSKQKEGIA
ncbi:MAG: 4Fe-4S dicluster domain-containing protein, partial [Candidatus Lokiarchaeota archaeon]|nr:4Fe-4S dicluster domain-containing protein [Candidatus Lokiarchaeota archaeon]